MKQLTKKAIYLGTKSFLIKFGLFELMCILLVKKDFFTLIFSITKEESKLHTGFTHYFLIIAPIIMTIGIFMILIGEIINKIEEEIINEIEEK